MFDLTFVRCFDLIKSFFSGSTFYAEYGQFHRSIVLGDWSIRVFCDVDGKLSVDGYNKVTCGIWEWYTFEDKAELMSHLQRVQESYDQYISKEAWDLGL